MKASAEHPMDHIKVRPLRFNKDKLRVADCAWSRTSPQFSVFLNAFGLHVPYFEKYLIVALRKAREQIRDDRLLRDVTAIIGQEANHATQFISWNEVLTARYPEVAPVDAKVREAFAAAAKSDSLKRLVGFTAGYETFTFLAGMIILDNYHRWMADSDPTLKALWVWHQVEEVEHGAVAFDVYKHLYGGDELYRKWMVLVALSHMAAETIKAYVPMARGEGWLRNPFKAASRLGFCVTMLLRLLVNALPVLRKSYVPQKHPMVTTRQNPIQIAWRRFEREGGDVLEIDRARMAQMLGVPEPIDVRMV